MLPPRERLSICTVRVAIVKVSSETSFARHGDLQVGAADDEIAGEVERYALQRAGEGELILAVVWRLAMVGRSTLKRSSIDPSNGITLCLPASAHHRPIISITLVAVVGCHVLGPGVVGGEVGSVVPTR